jgi:energy-coupling factor transporter ATP-binding protein EcfA2
MLKKLRIRNFRPFKSFEIDFSEFNLLVGKNNMGKTTVIDALRLISTVADYNSRRRFGPLPEDAFEQEEDGFFLEEREIPFPLTHSHHEYTDENVLLEAQFEDDISIQIALTSSHIHYASVMRHGASLDNKSLIRDVLSTIRSEVLPPVAPFEENEPLLNEEYIWRWFGTHRTPRHFRNVWWYWPDGFDAFRRRLRETWEGVDIAKPELPKDLRAPPALEMFWLENNITREISWAGDGLQIWMQLLTYITKWAGCPTLVLDEPDLFLHSEPQRQLVDVLKELDSQVIVATHSVEMIDRVSPEEIVVVDKNLKEGQRLTMVKEVQDAVRQLGSAQNVQLLSLLRSKSLLFVEGKDYRILSSLAETLGYPEFSSETRFNVIKLEGVENWKRLESVDWILKNALGERMQVSVILDRDFRPSEEVSDLKKRLLKRKVKPYVWQKKEIENYLLVPEVLYDSVCDLMKGRKRSASAPSFKEFSKIFDDILEKSKTYVHSQMLSKTLQKERPKGLDDSTVIANFNQKFDSEWKTRKYQLRNAPGKDVLANLNTVLQQKFGVSLTTGRILRTMESKWISKEIKEVIEEILSSS